MNRATSIALRGPRAVLSVPAAATTARRSRWSTAANAALTSNRGIRPPYVRGRKCSVGCLPLRRLFPCRTAADTLRIVALVLAFAVLVRR